jgi:HK97 family phage portal protein
VPPPVRLTRTRIRARTNPVRARKPARKKKQAYPLVPADTGRGWWPVIREPYSGAWQNNEDLSLANVSTHSIVFACITLIASDIAKVRPRMVRLTDDGIWIETDVPAFSPILRKPNRFQNRVQFYESWVISKLLWGNTYVLKQMDERGTVRAMYVLDPSRVVPLVAPDGAVYYGLRRDHLSQLSGDEEIVPASFIIHDRHNTMFHPLVGLSALYACGLAAAQGLTIQNNSSKFFANGSKPGGVLTAPGTIKQETADRIKSYVTENFASDSIGKLMVLGDGLEYKPTGMSAIDAQLIDQQRWTGETACATFHVPPYMVGIGKPPNYNNIQALNQQYYSQCLQVLMTAIELCLDEGLGLTEGEVAAKRYGVYFDIDDLLMMDTKNLIESEKQAAGIKSPNESRKRLNLPPVDGGDQPFLQEQNWPVTQLASRDTADLSKQKPPARALPPAAETVDGEVVEEDDPPAARSAQCLD